MTTESKPMSEYKFDHVFAANYGRQLFGGAPDTIGQAYVVQAMRKQFDIDIKAIADLQKQVDELKIELDQAKDPTYCTLCRSCGIDMCCPAHGCAHPNIKSETLKELKEDNIQLQQQIADYEKALEFYADRNGEYDWPVDAQQVLAKYRGQNGM